MMLVSAGHHLGKLRPTSVVPWFREGTAQESGHLVFVARFKCLFHDQMLPKHTICSYDTRQPLCITFLFLITSPRPGLEVSRATTTATPPLSRCYLIASTLRQPCLSSHLARVNFPKNDGIPSSSVEIFGLFD
jgi:hypothetical protein